jgi:hypothetical protein
MTGERVLCFDEDRPRARGPFCCEPMGRAAALSCDRHDSPFDCADTLIYYSPRFDEYGLIVHDGGASYVLISHCPWCGRGLPASRRDEWFERLEALGFDDPIRQDVPEEFLSDGWYRRG